MLYTTLTTPISHYRVTGRHHCHESWSPYRREVHRWMISEFQMLMSLSHQRVFLQRKENGFPFLVWLWLTTNRIYVFVTQSCALLGQIIRHPSCKMSVSTIKVLGKSQQSQPFSIHSAAFQKMNKCWWPILLQARFISVLSLMITLQLQYAAISRVPN